RSRTVTGVQTCALPIWAEGAVVVFDAVSEVRLFILVFISVYTLVLFAYVITSWVQLPYSLRGVQSFLADVCEPYLRLWRRILPRSEERRVGNGYSHQFT